MYISKLSIKNFRNFKDVTLTFNKGINTILGENGTGKTNLLYALRLLIDDSLPRNVKFSESDFNRTLTDWRGHWIMIATEFSELDSGEEMQSIVIHSLADAGDVIEKGTCGLYVRPKESVRRDLYSYSQNPDKNAVGLKSLLEKITINDYECVYVGRSNFDFNNESEYKKYVGDFEKIVFPNPDEKAEDVYGVKLTSISIPNEVSCTFVKALRDVEEELKSYRNSPLLSLLRGKEKTIDVASKKKIYDQVVSLNTDIGNLDEVKDVSAGISKNIKEAVGQTYAPIVSVRSDLPQDMDKLLQSLKLSVGDPDDIGYQGKIGELSLGGANLIYVSLKLLEYEKVKQSDKVANFLIIEEPEAHIHTHIQKTLFQNLEKNRTQVIVSTHSTHISSSSKISSINILSKNKGTTEVFQPSNGLDPEEVSRAERYLDAVRSTLLFSKGVILVEGDAEQILIPTIFKQSFGISLDEIGVSLINIGSTGFKSVANLFNDLRIKKKCSILTDLDESIMPVVEGNIEPDMYLRSQKSGAERKVILDNFVEGNKWVKPFYAKHTFEVDFLLSGNVDGILNSVSKVYSGKKAIEEVKAQLVSEDTFLRSKAVLRLARKCGKGWYALRLAEEIDWKVNIPEYILDSISFASSHLSNQSIAVMATYRLQMINSKKSKALLEKVDNLKSPEDYQGFVNSYKTEFPEDLLTIFINKI